MKHILLFGAGKSATVLIDYLKELATENAYKVTIADSNLKSVQLKVGQHKLVEPAGIDVTNEVERRSLIKNADVVISLLPPSLHYLVAVDCVQFGKHLLTASYIDEKIKALKDDVQKKDILFLCEMGLDPGIDHMSAMQLIDRIKSLGGKITSFKSHCGGLVAPESDTNPWHYKISWNPRNVVLAGKGGAIFRENGTEKEVPYEEVFTVGNLVNLAEDQTLAYYPNRDSLRYIPLYKLEETTTFLRTTLRHPDFCFGWKNIVDLKFTDETPQYDTNGMTLAAFFKLHFDKYKFNEWLNEMLTTRLSFAKDLMDNLAKLIEAENELSTKGEQTDESIMLVNEEGQLDTLQIEDVKGQAAATLAVKMHEANLTLKQLFFLGLDSNELINKGLCSAADILQFVLEKKLALEPTDKDMVVMIHEIVYELNGITNYVKSSLIAKGEDSVHTAMAKTVGLPLGIAAKLILEGSLTITGLHIPILPAIYSPVLKELEKHGISFEESLE
ncbi:MAG TPA: saccharopine dehydrogenase C-terminal domain-containing protein [Segetibacter sp.]|jgi:saccharopine dehydrogenase-like NADP-dependent oxidoreductase